MRGESKSLILDQFGKPVSYNSFYQGGSPFRRGDISPQYIFSAPRDTTEQLTLPAWRQLMISGRFLFVNVPIVRGCLLEQANYSFPIITQYAGKDADWGKLAEEWLYEWKKINNVRGGPYDQHTNSRIRMLGYKVDGDIGTILTNSDNGFPLVQYVRAHRIGSRGPDGEIKKGPYKGYLQFNGIIRNANGLTVGYHVLGDSEDEDQWISANDMFLTFRPDFADEVRGVSHLVASITSYEDVARLREYEMRAQQIGASIGLIEKNENGGPDTNSPSINVPPEGTPVANTNGTATGLVTQTLEQGLIKYFRSNTGSGLEAFRNDRPSADAQAFEDKIVAGALYGTEWDPNFALSIKEPGGALSRVMIQKINRCIQNNVFVEARAQRREDWYAICKAIKLKQLPMPKDGDTYSWEYHLGIPEITADSGNDRSADREEFKLGGTTLRDWQMKYGKWWRETRGQREVENRDLLERVTKFKKDFADLNLSTQEILDLFEKRNANSPPTAPEEFNQQQQ